MCRMVSNVFQSGNLFDSSVYCFLLELSYIMCLLNKCEGVLVS